MITAQRELPLWGVLGLLAVAYGQSLAPSITWANGGADSGDLVTAAAVLGVAHPTGYPTYLLLAKAFQHLPIGDLAFRTNLLSLVAALGAAWLTGRVVFTCCADQPHALWSGALAALVLGLSPLFWSQAVIAEVHSLNTLFVAALALLALLELRPQGSAASARVGGFIAGLGLGNHVTIGAMVLCWLVAAATCAPSGQRLRTLGRRALWVGAGLLVYLYLPLRAATQPPVNWGGASSFSGFWWVVSGAPYRTLLFGLSADLIPQRIAAWATLLLEQFGLAGVLLGFGGLVYSTALQRRERLASLCIVGFYSFFALLYDTADSYAYLLPAYVLFAVWIGCGASQLLAQRGKLGVVGAWGVVLSAVLVVASAPATAQRVDASQDHRAVAFAAAVLQAAPPHAVVLTSGDEDSFALWYVHFALGQRPDTVIVVDSLLDYSWYRTNLRASYPTLRIPPPSLKGWAVVLAEANTHRVICRVIDTDAGRLDCTNQ